MRHKSAALFLVAGLVCLSFQPRLCAGSAGLNVLHAFIGTNTAKTNTEGAYPQGGVVSSGNALFGTGENGGKYGSGVIFRVNTDGSDFTNLYDFTANLESSNTNSDGIYPATGLLLVGDTLYGSANIGGLYGNGTLFSIHADGSGFTNIHNFSAPSGSNLTNSDGYNPDVTLIFSGNRLYGAANEGGTGGSGTLFAINPDGSGFTNLHNFSATSGSEFTNSDGTHPGFLYLSNNLLCGVAIQGGRYGGGDVFTLNTDGSGFTNLHDFMPYVTGDGSFPHGFVVSGKTLYGTTTGGGNRATIVNSNYGIGTVYSLNLTDGSAYTNLHIFDSYDGALPTGLVLSNSILYGVTASGGDSINPLTGYGGAGTVFSINVDGLDFTNLYDFMPVLGHSGVIGTNADGAQPGATLILAGGALYILAENGGVFGEGTVASLGSSGFTNLHSFSALTQGLLTDDGAGPAAGLILSGNTFYGTAADGGSVGYGSVFRVDVDGSHYTNLYDFTGSTNDGAYPMADLVLFGNTLYGTTENGGSSFGGTVFAINTDGSGFTNLYSFTGPNDGLNPLAGLTLSGTTLYGATVNGGSAGNGAIFALNTDGSGFTNLYNFTDLDNDASTNSDGADPISTLVLSGGLLYGTTSAGGSSDNGTLFAISTNGQIFANLHNFTGGSDGADPAAGLILSGSTLYGTASSGGSFQRGTIFSIDTSGSGFTPLYSFTALTGPNSTNSDGANPAAALLVSGGILYGTTPAGGTSGNGTLFSFNPADGPSGFTNLYNFTRGSDGANPAGDLLLLGNTLYGTAENGGSLLNGTVFALPLSGVTAPAPSLVITGAGNQYTLYWPSAAANYTLQTAGNIPSQNWTDITTGISTLGTNFTYTNTATGTAAFFRLRSH